YWCLEKISKPYLPLFSRGFFLAYWVGMLRIMHSKIAALSSGEFVGMVADNPDEKINLKAFHCEILNDHEALAAEEKSYQPIPVIRKINNILVQRNYQQIKEEVQEIVNAEIQRMMNDPELEGLVVKK